MTRRAFRPIVWASVLLAAVTGPILVLFAVSGRDSCPRLHMVVTTNGFQVASGTPGAHFDIVLTTNGLPTLAGVPLGRGFARDAVFGCLRLVGFPVRVVLDSGGTSGGRDLVQTLTAMTKSGLSCTNMPPGR